jgi:hypothetical protein
MRRLPLAYGALLALLAALMTGSLQAQPSGVQPLVQPAPGVDVVPLGTPEPLQRQAHEAVPVAVAGPWFDDAGLVRHANPQRLPEDCPAVSTDIAFTVRAGTAHAAAGQVYGYDSLAYAAPPCARVTVTLINDDAIRHQWQLLGLPEALHPGGEFLLEANGGQQVTGSFIVPGAAARFPVQCSHAGHATAGMQTWLRVEAPAPRLPRGALVLILAMALTSASLVLTMHKRTE